MPQNLMDSGNADFVLRPSEMPEMLARYVSHPYVRGEPAVETPADDQQKQLGEILTVLHTRTRRLWLLFLLSMA